MAQVGKTMDVGVDGNKLYPYSLSDIRAVMARRAISSPVNFDDHHIKL
jgi:hypothetical protein